MKLLDLIKANRSYRRFHEDQPVGFETLKSLIELARLSPSARNAQSLKFHIATNRDLLIKVFPCLTWAGYIKDWPGPKEGERPTGYITILNDKNISQNYFCDHGIAAQSILLGAVERGFGGCIIAAINREKLAKVLNLPDHLEILLVLAVGTPNESIIIEKLHHPEDTKYWRTADEIHHVPKRDLDDIILHE